MRLLMSTRLGPVTGHGYLVRRGRREADDFDYVSNTLSNAMELAAKKGGVFWLPVLLSTELDAEEGKRIQALIRSQGDTKAVGPLDAFEAGREPLFIVVWIMPSDNPECEWLMKLH